MIRTRPIRPGGTSSNDAVSSIAAQRSAAAVCPVKRLVPTGQHSERREGPRQRSRRASTAIAQPSISGLPGTSAAAVARPAVRSGPVLVAVRRCSTASARDPLDSYQSAARRCSSAMTSGSAVTKLSEQELSKEAVVPVPLAPAIERDEERVRSLEPAQLLLCARLSEHGLTQRRAQLIEQRRATKEPLIALGQLAQRLAIQIVRDVAVVPRDRRCRATLVAGDERRQVQADRPAFGAFGHRRRLFARQRDLCAREDLFGAGRSREQGRSRRSRAHHPTLASSV